MRRRRRARPPPRLRAAEISACDRRLLGDHHALRKLAVQGCLRSDCHAIDVRLPVTLERLVLMEVHVAGGIRNDTLGRAPRLRDLQLVGLPKSSVQFDGRALASLSNLTNLNLNHTEFSFDLASTSLRHLMMGYGEYTPLDEGVSLRNLPNLTELSLIDSLCADVWWTGAEARELAARQLRALFALGLSRDFSPILPTLTNLTSLQLSCYGNGDDALSPPSSLRRLSIDGWADEDLLPTLALSLRQCTRLDELTLQDVMIHGSLDVPSLRALELVGCEMCAEPPATPQTLRLKNCKIVCCVDDRTVVRVLPDTLV